MNRDFMKPSRIAQQRRRLEARDIQHTIRDALAKGFLKDDAEYVARREQSKRDRAVGAR